MTVWSTYDLEEDYAAAGTEEMLSLNDRIRVLFVCTGNICRSPTAEGLFNHEIAKAGLADYFEADSAGMIGYHEGESPDPRAREVASTRGVSLSQLRARKLRESDFDRFDYIIAMDHSHLDSLYAMAPHHYSKDKIRLLMSFTGSHARVMDVPDPYYGSKLEFERTYEIIEIGMNGFLDYLKAAHLA